MTVTSIKKRNGSIVDFDRSRIELAIQKACLACDTKVDKEFLTLITDDIVRIADERYGGHTPNVEDIQDVVESMLAERGLFKVAKSYIIYRYEHSKERQEKHKDILEKIEKNDLFVVKKSGKKEVFSIEKLKKSLSFAIKGYEDVVNIDAIAMQCKNELYDGMATRDIRRALIMTTRALIEQDPAYSKIASRLLLSKIYEEVIGENVNYQNFENEYREAFVRKIKEGVKIKRLDPRMLALDLEAISQMIDPSRDDLFLYMGTQVIYDRYFLQNPYKKTVLETPQAFWMRIAMGLALLEENPEEWIGKFYDLLSSLRFVSSTPTLFHAGTAHPQLSSCYLNTVEDDLHHIFKVIGDNAQLSKWSGGIGTDWTNLRGIGALIKGTGVESQGVVPFLKIANDATVAINRSGRRRGAACVYLEVWHYDIEHFLELRKNTGDERRRTHDMDTANWIPDLFMKRVRDDGSWTLFSPDETPDLHHIYGKNFDERYENYERKAEAGEMALFKTMKARDLWKKMLSMLFETGHPWITFKDPCNVRSPQDHVGVIHNSNLCTEITLNTSADETAVCNLGSVNLARHVTNGKLDTELIKDTVTTAMRMLDNTIDVNFYPTKEAKLSNMRHRPLGLGIMGFQDALYMLDIQFDSEACVEFADRSMEVVSYHAILASSQIAKERGAYQSFHGSKWDRDILPQDTLDLLERERGEKIDVPRGGVLDWTPVRESIKKYGMRNSNCLAIAPTATISNISGCIPTVEPIYKNIYAKSNMSGDFTVVNSYLVDELKKLNLWDFEMLGQIKYHDGSIREIKAIPENIREKYKEVFEIDAKWLIKAAAQRGKWIDQSQSLNLYFVGTSGKLLGDLYQYAWSLGLKTTYYLRTLAASQVEKATVSTAEFGSTHTRKNAEVSSAPVVEKQPVPFPVGSTAAQAPVPQCKIDDPTCESCQ